MPSNQQEKLQELVKAGKLERVPFKAKIFAQQIQSCSQSRTDAQALLDNESIQGSFVLAYTYIRKSATLLLYRRGVRPTARGGHRVIFDALGVDQRVPYELTKSYDNLRAKRNSIEYPESFIESVEPGLILQCFEIGDQLVAIAQSISS